MVVHQPYWNNFKKSNCLLFWQLEGGDVHSWEVDSPPNPRVWGWDAGGDGDIGKENAAIKQLLVFHFSAFVSLLHSHLWHSYKFIDHGVHIL